MNPKTKFEGIATGVSLFTLSGLATLFHDSPKALGLAVAVALGIILRHIISLASGWIVRAFALLLVAAWLTPDCNAQALPNEPEPAPGYDWSNVAALQMSVPEYPGQERSPIIAAAVCVGVAAGIAGYIGVRILCAIINNREHVVTNNAACGECPQESPLPTSPVPTPAPSGANTVTVCVQCSEAPDRAPAGQPLPLRIEHSFDQATWTEVATGVAVGTEFTLPDTGYWRAVPLFLSLSNVDGVLTLHAPPGVLEFSSDLRSWESVGTFSTEHDLAAQAGFYRVRLN